DELVNLSGNERHRAVETRLTNKVARFREQYPLRFPVDDSGEWRSFRSAGKPILASPERRESVKPNVIIIFADDLGYEDLGVQGSTEAITPHLDSIAENGIRFTNGYVTSPVCSPSRAGLLTGRYQNRFGFEFLAQDDAVPLPGHKVGLDPDEVTIAERMKELGYVTGCIGKWHLGDEEEFLPMNHGFDEFYGTLGQSGYYTPMLLDSRLGDKPKKVSKPGYYVTDDYSRRAVEFVREHKDKPFFLYLSHFAVHKPHDATEAYLSRFPHIEDETRRAYLAMLSAMDDGVGKLLATLEETGLANSTLVAFLSDNGGTMGSSNAPLNGRKGGTWEGGIRVPFLMQWKSHLPAGKVYEDPVLSLDLLPTAVVAAGGIVQSDWSLDGVDLIPFLNGEREGCPHEALYWRFGTQWAIRMGDWKALQAREAKGGNIQIANEGPLRLFQLSDDIGEAKDLQPENGGRAGKLRADWERWNAELPEPFWRPVLPEN
ncbi:MAG: sulfatase-like hydrolase/transferase, partial [Verrucomicrobiota bacterium]